MVARTRRELGGGGITLEGASRMKRIDNRYGEDSVITSDTITKFPYESTPPVTFDGVTPSWV